MIMRTYCPLPVSLPPSSPLPELPQSSSPPPCADYEPLGDDQNEHQAISFETHAVGEVDDWVRWSLSVPVLGLNHQNQLGQV